MDPLHKDMHTKETTLLRSKLKVVHEKRNRDNAKQHDILELPPIVKLKRDMKKQVTRDRAYRVSIIKKIHVFNSLDDAQLQAAADTMVEMFLRKGDVLMQQDDIGDAFYVLEDGKVEVTRRVNSRNKAEVPLLLCVLGKNTYFGEISLMTEEPRSATVTICSPTAKCLRMTKSEFSEILQHAKSICQALQMKIGQDVVEKVPIFKALSKSDKKSMIGSMSAVDFPAGSYICRQGAPGNVFYIITEGSCKVTLDMPNDQPEKFLLNYHAGDFFGEKALLDAAGKRTANVISTTPVTCMSLNRNDFNNTFKHLRAQLMEHQAMQSANAQQAQSHGGQQLSKRALIKKNNERRRITTFGPDTKASPARLLNFIRRISKFLTESLYLSLYAKLYAAMVVNPGGAHVFGDHALQILHSCSERTTAIPAIQEKVRSILETHAAKRGDREHELICGLLRQRNHLTDRCCKDWPAYQITDLCKSATIQVEVAQKKIFETGQRGTCAYLVLRGCVRTFTHPLDLSTGKKTLLIEEDFGPGEVVGEDALGGMQQRFVTAIALTAVDLLKIEYEAFVASHHDRNANQLTADEKYRFVSNIAMFKGWEQYQLFRLSHALQQVDFEKGQEVVKKGVTSDQLLFLVHGKCDILASHKSMDPVVTVQKFDYVGETGVISAHFKDTTQREPLLEAFTVVAVSKCEFLSLSKEQYNLCHDHDTMTTMHVAFDKKIYWRLDRKKHMKIEKQVVAKLKKDLFEKGGALLALQDALKEKPSSPKGKSMASHSPVRQMQSEAPVDPSLPKEHEHLFSPKHISSAAQAASSAASLAPSTVAESANSNMSPPGTAMSAISRVTTASVASRASSAKSLVSSDDYRSVSLRSVEDIPSFVNKECDPFLILSSCKNEKESRKKCSTLAFLQLPPNARKRIHQLVGVKNRHKTPSSVGRMKQMLNSDMAARIPTFQSSFDKFSLANQQQQYFSRSCNNSTIDSYDDESRRQSFNEEIPGEDDDDAGSSDSENSYDDSAARSRNVHMDATFDVHVSNGII